MRQALAGMLWSKQFFSFDLEQWLAEHGAEVLQIAHPEEFEHEALIQDPCAGFTSNAWLDLNQADARHKAVASAADIDTAMRLGTNYPLGPLAWGQSWGPAAVLAVLDALHAWYGEDRYRPSALLRRIAAAGGSLT